MKKITALLENPELIKLIKFCIVGAINTGISMLVFALLVKYSPIGPQASYIISYCAGLLNSYLLNKFWTFRASEQTTGAMVAKFIVINLIALGVGTLIFALSFKYCQLNKYFSQFIALIFSTIINFIGNRCLVFRSGRS